MRGEKESVCVCVCVCVGGGAKWAGVLLFPAPQELL